MFDVNAAIIKNTAISSRFTEIYDDLERDSRCRHLLPRWCYCTCRPAGRGWAE
jgi:hypothetical protein